MFASHLDCSAESHDPVTWSTDVSTAKEQEGDRRRERGKKKKIWGEGEKETEERRTEKRETAISLIPSTHLAAAFFVIYLFPPLFN